MDRLERPAIVCLCDGNVDRDGAQVEVRTANSLATELGGLPARIFAHRLAQTDTDDDERKHDTLYDRDLVGSRTLRWRDG